jgi:hypothetical protein
VPKLFSQGPTATREQRLQGFNADTQNLRRFNVAAVLVVAENDGRALAMGQLLDGVQNSARDVTFAQGRFLVGRWIGNVNGIIEI